MFAYYLQASRRDSLDRLRSVLEAVSPPDAVVVSPDTAPLGWRSTWISLGSADPETWRSWVDAHRPSTIVVEGSDEHLRIAKTSAQKVAAVATPGGGRDGTEPSYGDADLVLAPWPAGRAGVSPATWQDRALHLGAVGWAARAAVRRRTPRIARTGEHWSCVHLIPTAAGPGPRARRHLAEATPGWHWLVANENDVLGEGPTWDHLLRADVVVCAPTQGNLAAAAAARIPAVLMLPERPTPSELFLARLAEQTAPVVVLPAPQTDDRWRLVLTRARELDGSGWAAWDPEPALKRLGELLRTSQGAETSIPRQRADPTVLTSV